MKCARFSLDCVYRSFLERKPREGECFATTNFDVNRVPELAHVIRSSQGKRSESMLLVISWKAKVDVQNSVTSNQWLLFFSAKRGGGRRAADYRLTAARIPHPAARSPLPPTVGKTKISEFLSRGIKPAIISGNRSDALPLGTR